jgi:hypothetical protein
MVQPVFSIVSPDFDAVVSDERRAACVSSVIRQSFPLWELLLIHDGPRKKEIPISSDPRIRYIQTDDRHNDWGHSLRDIGIREAKGRYILHLNADNLIYEHCLAIVYAYSLRKPLKFKQKKLPQSDVQASMIVNPGVLIFGVKMMGKLSIAAGDSAYRLPGHEERFQAILPGWPPRRNRIDAMQLVATKKIWEKIDGWYDKSKESDGIIYQKLCHDFGYLVIPDVLGEHW